VSSYDDVPYDGQAFATTHPGRLFAVGRLFGMTPPPVATSRVLELGCAAGWNLLPMAEHLPDAQFVGVDLSARQIAEAREIAETCGIANVRLEQASILDVDLSWGTFDYILVHGVYSWVPEPVQRAILTICARQLTPHGIAYVSYNTFPGWHMRAMVRDMMRFHAARFDTPEARIDESRALLEFLTREATQDEPYQALLRRELGALQQAADSYLYHEHLEEINEPVYFHEFAARARQHGLRYLGESRVTTMVAANLGDEARETLQRIAGDEIEAEQYMDFVRNRMFRETLLVHGVQRLTREIPPSALQGLHVGSLAALVAPPDDLHMALADDRSMTFSGPGAKEISTRSPHLKTALWLLQQEHPRTRPFDELRRAVRAHWGGDPDDATNAAHDADRLGAGLLTCYLQSSLVQLHGCAVACARTTDGPLRIGRVSRETARRRRMVATHRHEGLRLDELLAELVVLLDGTRDASALVDELTARVLRGELPMERDGTPLTEATDVRAMLEPVVAAQLERLRAAAVLDG
jgi:methyltransferase-like protein/SAM-dependent methyltransferase